MITMIINLGQCFPTALILFAHGWDSLLVGRRQDITSLAYWLSCLWSLVLVSCGRNRIELLRVMGGTLQCSPMQLLVPLIHLSFITLPLDRQWHCNRVTLITLAFSLRSWWSSWKEKRTAQKLVKYRNTKCRQRTCTQFPLMVDIWPKFYFWYFLLFHLFVALDSPRTLGKDAHPSK